MSTLINHASLDEMLNLLGDEFREITRMFVDQMDEEVAQLRAARADEDWPRLNRRAHALKGSSGNMGAMLLSESAARLEKAAREVDLPTIDRELAAIDRLAPETVEALRSGQYL